MKGHVYTFNALVLAHTILEGLLCRTSSQGRRFLTSAFRAQLIIEEGLRYQGCEQLYRVSVPMVVLLIEQPTESSLWRCNWFQGVYDESLVGERGAPQIQPCASLS